MAGVTFLAFGNGSPDVFSTFAAMSTHSGSLAVGELIGAAGFITAVVAGSMALVRPFKVAKRSFVRDVGFFILSASFTIWFLVDGRLRLWECALMVGFYGFYVVVVMVWHWLLRRRRKRRERDAISRGYYVTQGSEEVEIEEEEEEEDGVGANAGERRSLLWHGSVEDFGSLERGGLAPRLAARDEEDEEEDRESDQERWLADVNSNMRVSRRPRHERRNTLNPIRPSLVGALEFRAVLSSLQKSRAIQTLPIPLRRYSDDPNYTDVHHRLPSVSDVAVESNSGSEAPEVSSGGDNPGALGRRARAVSTNDAIGLNLDSSSFRRNVPDIDILVSTPPATGRHQVSEFDPAPASNVTTPVRRSPSPSISISPPPSHQGSRQSSQSQKPTQGPSPNLLAPPQEGYGGSQRTTLPLSASSTDSTYSPKSQLPRITIPQYSDDPEIPASEFPIFYDSPLPISAHGGSRPPSIRLPPPSLSLSPSFYSQDGESQGRPLWWWPYSILPSPDVLGATMFPTFCGFKEKNIYEKLLGLIVAPSVFLLTVTLPVVENERDGTKELVPTDRTREFRSRAGTGVTITPSLEYNDSAAGVPRQMPSVPSVRVSHEPSSSAAERSSGQENLAGIAGSAEATGGYFQPKPSQALGLDRGTSSSTAPAQTPNEWNRWLVAVQILSGPLFVVIIVWANTTDDTTNLRTLLHPVLYALLTSLVALALLLLTTTADHPPRWHFLLCFVGFAVSVAWISTIAKEVVGVLKAVGVILGISDAILGLTVFAVGNSLGDLVADVTVARLGLPVMALSACFGGPMLNILLGIGMSGLYIMIRDEGNHHEKHPNKDIRYKPYEIEVSSAIMISGATLLITLVGLLIAVPWNKWMMDRRIGWGLIALWTLSTLGNLMVEITGWGGSIS
jgi:solute carrier family 24 (sodium/potassium/calcium exchanger), member 6